METLPCSSCRGLCCGPVSITAQELKSIKKKIKTMPAGQRRALEEQERFFGTCIFYDEKKNKCGIYTVRPQVCREFGHRSNMVCFRNPAAAVKAEWRYNQKPIGTLSVDYTWKDF